MSRVICFAFVCLTYPSIVFAEFDIGSGGGGILGRITLFLQDIANWVSGPVGLFCVGLALLGAVIAWNRSPQQSEWVGKTFRALISALAVMGFGGFMSWLAGYVS